MHFSSRTIKLIRLVLIVKFTGLLLYALNEKGWLRIGELASWAQEPSDKAEDSYVDPKGEDSIAKKLENLIDLPQLSTEKMDKEEISRLFAMLVRKKEQVEKRLILLTGKYEAIEKIEKTIDVKLASLESEKKLIEETIQKEKEISKERLDGLLAIYQKMTPKKAAPVFEKMDKDLVVALFKAMPQKQTMGILTAMSADKAVELSQYYARVGSLKEYEMLESVDGSLKDAFKACKEIDSTQ